MNCKNCGCALDSGAEICYACGTPVDAPETVREPYTLDDPVAAPAVEEAQQESVRPARVDNAQKAGLFTRIVSFLFALVGLILFGVQKKNGEEAKAVSVADAIMGGLCAKMAFAICYFVVGMVMHR